MYSELPYIPCGDVNGEGFTKGSEKCKFFASLMDKRVEKGCPKVQDLVDEEMWICWSFPFRHYTTHHCAERKATHHCAECEAKFFGR